MKVYLDNCCLNRPFDDQTNLRIHLESEAIKVIFLSCEQGHWDLIISVVSKYEVANTPDNARRKQLELMIEIADDMIEINENIEKRAKQFEISTGMKAFDALHLACAETKADVFLTVDDQFLKKARSIENLNVQVENPLKWAEKVL